MRRYAQFVLIAIGLSVGLVGCYVESEMKPTAERPSTTPTTKPKSTNQPRTSLSSSDQDTPMTPTPSQETPTPTDPKVRKASEQTEDYVKRLQRSREARRLDGKDTRPSGKRDDARPAPPSVSKSAAYSDVDLVEGDRTRAVQPMSIGGSDETIPRAARDKPKSPPEKAPALSQPPAKVTPDKPLVPKETPDVKAPPSRPPTLPARKPDAAAAAPEPKATTPKPAPKVEPRSPVEKPTPQSGGPKEVAVPPKSSTPKSPTPKPESTPEINKPAQEPTSPKTPEPKPDPAEPTPIELPKAPEKKEPATARPEPSKPTPPKPIIKPSEKPETSLPEPAKAFRVPPPPTMSTRPAKKASEKQEPSVPPAQPAVDVKAPQAAQDEPKSPAGGANQPAKTGPQSEADIKTIIRKKLAEVAENPNDLEKQITLRLLYLANNQPEKALAEIPGTNADTQAMINQLMEILITAREGDVKDPALAAQKMLTKVEELRGFLKRHADLEIPKLALCTRVQRFGVYDEISPPTFEAGKVNKAIVYCEVANYTTKPTDDNNYRVLLAQRIQVLNKAGKTILESTDDDIPYISPTKVGDFYLVQLLELPADLPPGDYVLRVYVADKQAAKAQERDLEFRLTAPSR